MKLNLNNKVILSILICISLLQTFFIMKSNGSIMNDSEEIIDTSKETYFNDIQSLFNKVKDIKNIEISEMNNFDKKGITIKFNGDYDKIKSILKDLNNYKIDDYLINYENKIYNIVIHLFIE